VSINSGFDVLPDNLFSKWAVRQVVLQHFGFNLVDGVRRVWIDSALSARRQQGDTISRFRVVGAPRAKLPQRITHLIEYKRIGIVIVTQNMSFRHDIPLAGLSARCFSSK
jgi:hypothetical protein